jgi:hypothetical protein
MNSIATAKIIAVRTSFFLSTGPPPELDSRPRPHVSQRCSLRFQPKSHKSCRALAQRKYERQSSLPGRAARRAAGPQMNALEELSRPRAPSGVATGISIGAIAAA